MAATTTHQYIKSGLYGLDVYLPKGQAPTVEEMNAIVCIAFKVDTELIQAEPALNYPMIKEGYGDTIQFKMEGESLTLDQIFWA